MKNQKIEYTAECPNCKGTGLYIGMAERDGAAVVCTTCEGTGEIQESITYTPFTGRKENPKIKRVYATNPGIMIGCGDRYKLEDFGGLDYKTWVKSGKFPEGSEMRKFSCPSWFYQCADYKRKPEWPECYKSLGGTFSSCPYYGEKSKCWERFDEEQRKK